LLVVSDPTQRGLVAAGRIAAFRKELDIHIEHAYLVLNRLNGPLPPALAVFIENNMDIPLLATIPADIELGNFDINGRPLIELSDNSPIYQAVAEMLRKIL